jgi:hypothetical protein
VLPPLLPAKPTCLSAVAEGDISSACNCLDLVPATTAVGGSVPPMGTGSWTSYGRDKNETDGARRHRGSKTRSMASFVA